MNNPVRRRRLQSGLILPMMLLCLLVMLLIGSGALRAALFEEKMAANAGNLQAAFQAAEHALRFCENRLQLSPIVIPLLEPGPAAADDNGKPYWEIADSWRNGEVSVAVPHTAGEGLPPAAPARCLVERLQFDADLQYRQHLPPPRPAFRITARGVGTSNASVVMLQSYLLL